MRCGKVSPSLPSLCVIDGYAQYAVHSGGFAPGVGDSIVSFELAVRPDAGVPFTLAVSLDLEADRLVMHTGALGI